MPPMLTDDDMSDGSDGVDEIVPPKKGAKKAPAKNGAKPADKDLSDAGEDEMGNDDDEEEEQEYVVEEIVGHAFEDDGTVKYEVKWYGYESKADRTWEPEENLTEGAAEVLKKYHKKIGGKPVFRPHTPAIKGRGRKRKSQPAEATSDVQSSAASKKRKVNGSAAKSSQLPVGSWEAEVQTVSTIEQKMVAPPGGKTPEKTLMIFLEWNDGQLTEHSATTVRQKCPQKLLDYLLSKLAWRDASVPKPTDSLADQSPAPDEAIADETIADEGAADEVQTDQ